MSQGIDIATTVKVILVFIALGIFACIYYGINTIVGGIRLKFFHKRQSMITQGWRLIFLSGLLVLAWVWVFFRAEPVAYTIYPPSPTSTLTSTITLTPTITPTLKDTLTPTITETLQYTYTPELPTQAIATIQTPVGPDNSAVFSNLWFNTELGKDRKVPNDNLTSFEAPVTHIYGGFSFTDVTFGVQWTAVWLYEGEVFYLETKVWTTADGTGGYGYTDCQQDASKWLPGEYEVQIFVGSTFKSHGRFTITGNAETTLTQTLSILPDSTPTLQPTGLPGLVSTPTP